MKLIVGVLRRFSISVCFRPIPVRRSIATEPFSSCTEEPRPAIITIGISSPFEAWNVIIFTASAASCGTTASSSFPEFSRTASVYLRKSLSVPPPEDSKSAVYFNSSLMLASFLSPRSYVEMTEKKSVSSYILRISRSMELLAANVLNSLKCSMNLRHFSSGCLVIPRFLSSSRTVDALSVRTG